MGKLFYSRLALYFLAVLIPYFHPAIAVPYDLLSKWNWFLLVPAEMLIAFYLKPPRVKFYTGLLVSFGAILLSVIFVSGFGRAALLPLISGVFAYLATRLVFSGSGRGLTIAALELFFLGLVYFKIISFARASDDIAQTSGEITNIVMVLLFVAFSLHALVLYLAAFPDRSLKHRRNEFLWFFGVAVVAGAMFIVFVPKDFVTHDITFNDLDEEPPPKPRELDQDMKGESKSEGGKSDQEENKRNGKPLGDREEKFPSELQGGGADGDEKVEKREVRPDEHRGGGISEGNPNGEKGGQGQQKDKNGKQGKDQKKDKNRLEGLPAEQWNNQQQSGEGGGKQMAVMVIASPVSPVYAAEAYWGTFDAETGFSVTVDDKLNLLPNLRLLQTWKEPIPNEDAARKGIDIFYMSTIPNRVLAYKPFEIEPTVQDVTYKPFELSYRAKSLMSVSKPEDWQKIESLSTEERQMLGDYLQLTLSEDARGKFEKFILPKLKGKTGYFEKIDTVLKSLSGHKYEMGFDEDTSVQKLDRFLHTTKTGDCTEFSHTVALLLRIAGIPSRVVTGYLASKDLQTRAHRGGIYHLRKALPPLQKYPMDQLYLITSSHHHAWVQAYLPNYGWVDFETTAYAIPPKPEMDPNSMDVVIPLIEEKKEIKKKNFQFPYRLAGKVLLYALAGVLAFLYSFRIVRELYLRAKSRLQSRAGLNAMRSLLFFRLATNGYPHRSPSDTLLEYAKKHSELAAVAALHTKLSFKEMYDPGEKDKAWVDIRQSMNDVFEKSKKPGAWSFIKRTLSLRGIYY